jgi:hypothetical protein
MAYFTALIKKGFSNIPAYCPNGEEADFPFLSIFQNPEKMTCVVLNGCVWCMNKPGYFFYPLLGPPCQTGENDVNLIWVLFNFKNE